MILTDKNTDHESVKKFTGKKALFWIVGFFLVIFAVNAVMATIAVGTWGGLETSDAYRKGLYYNDELAAAKEQKASGWKIALSHGPQYMQGDRLDVAITWPDSDRPPAKVTAMITRAVTNAYDRQITLTKAGNDIYTASITLPLPGQWDIDILVNRPNGAIYQLKEKIFVMAKD